MKRIACMLTLLFAATIAGAQTLVPAQGFAHGYTLVHIFGTDLVRDSVQCDSLCSGAPACAVSVLFGTVEGDVELATPQAITVIAPPQPDGTTVDVTIRAPGREDRVIPHAFRYSNEAITTSADYVRYLAPLTKSLAGAGGSLWVAEAKLYNANDAPFAIPGTVWPPNTSPVDRPWIAPARDTTPLYFPSMDERDGAFFYIPRDADPNVTTQLRVRNTSNGDKSWGTEFTVVRESEFRHEVFLLDVPTDARFRATLRIYSIGSAPTTVHVRVLLPNHTDPIEEYDVDLAGIVEIIADPFPSAPAYAQLDPLSTAVRAAGSRVLVEVTSGSEQLPLWAFVSLTNNSTQQVTAVTPHRTEE